MDTAGSSNVAMYDDLRSPLARDWFAAQVRAGREHLCAEHLSVRGYEIFLPCYCERRQWSDRMKTMKRPLFAGYVFCRAHADVVGKIVTTPGVIRIVGDGARPLPVANDEIRRLQRVVEAGLAAEPCDFPRVGQVVQVIDGPLRGSEGLVLRTRNRHSLIISCSLLRRSVAVEIDPRCVRVCVKRVIGGVSSPGALVDGVTDSGERGRQIHSARI